MSMPPHKGERWACIEMVGAGWTGDKDRMDEDYGPCKVRYYELKCLCGKHFVVYSRNWTGKRGIRDCGCGIAADVGKRESHTSYLDKLTLNQIRWYADQKKISLNRAENDLIQYGYLWLAACNEIVDRPYSDNLQKGPSWAQKERMDEMRYIAEHPVEPEPEKKVEPVQVWDDGSGEWTQE